MTAVMPVDARDGSPDDAQVARTREKSPVYSVSDAPEESSMAGAENKDVEVRAIVRRVAAGRF